MHWNLPNGKIQIGYKDTNIVSCTSYTIEILLHINPATKNKTFVKFTLLDTVYNNRVVFSKEYKSEEFIALVLVKNYVFK